MRPPRKKSAPPSGYIPFPLRLNQSLNRSDGNIVPKIKGVVTESCEVRVDSPGDMALLYGLGFFGKGTLSKHEPVFHKVVEQPRDVIQYHLNSITLDRYSMSVVTDLRDRQLNSERVCPDKMAATFTVMSPAATLRQDIHTHQPTADSVSAEEAAEEGASFTEEDLPGVSLTGEFLPVGFTVHDGTKRRDEEMSWSGDDGDEQFWASDRLPQLSYNQTDLHGEATTTLQSTTQEKSAVTLNSSPKTAEPSENVESVIDSVRNADIIHSDSDDESCASSYDDYLSMSRLDIADTEEDKSEYTRLSEELLLSQYETVFLMLAFGCLLLTDHPREEEEVSLKELWRRCVSNDKHFLPRYVVYHHIRAKGWIPKDGVNYGCDFVMYKKGPKYYHSSVGVTVRCVNADDLHEIEEYNSSSLTWSKILGLNRVINNVRKELMVCYVLLPSDLSQSELEDPVVFLKKVTICESLVRRVVPSKEQQTTFNSPAHKNKQVERNNYKEQHRQQQ